MIAPQEEPPEYSANPGATSTGNSNPVQDVESNNQQPPSYESLFGQIKQARDDSDGNFDFAKTVSKILFASVACSIFVGVILAIPVAEIVIGAIYLHDCPAERYIPIYLVVAGSFGVFKGFLSFVQQIWKRHKQKSMSESEKAEEKPTNPVDSAINTFLFAWFIAGNVWVYRTVGGWVSEPSTAWNYCHPTLYYFAFWIITASYILVGVLCLSCIIMCVCVCACAKESK